MYIHTYTYMYPCVIYIVLSWQKNWFGFFCAMLQKNVDELFGQPNIYKYSFSHYCVINFPLSH